jgi:hypothetical protein
MSGTNIIPDGNAEIAAEIPHIVEIIARTCRWVHPDTYRQLPVWYPWTARGRPLYDSSWQRRYTNTKRATASKALIAALGVASPKPANWTVCHYDDPAFASQGSIVQDPRHFSCVANMVWLPTPLKGFTDALPDIKTMLRTCAFYLYGWACEHESVVDQATAIRAGKIPDGYPKSWPAPDRAGLFPPGTAPFTPAVMTEICKRKAAFKRMLTDMSLTHFPREEMQQVLAFWKVSL